MRLRSSSRFWMDSLRATSARVHNVQGLEAYLDLSRTWVS